MELAPETITRSITEQGESQSNPHLPQRRIEVRISTINKRDSKFSPWVKVYLYRLGHSVSYELQFSEECRFKTEEEALVFGKNYVQDFVEKIYVKKIDKLVEMLIGDDRDELMVI